MQRNHIDTRNEIEQAALAKNDAPLLTNEQLESLRDIHERINHSAGMAALDKFASEVRSLTAGARSRLLASAENLRAEAQAGEDDERATEFREWISEVQADESKSQSPLDVCHGIFAAQMFG